MSKTKTKAQPRPPQIDWTQIVWNMADAAVQAYHGDRQMILACGPVYLYYRRSTEHEHGELRFFADGVVPGPEWELTDPRAERGATPRPALVARVHEIARRLPILAWGK